jgi:hypothetical protein
MVEKVLADTSTGLTGSEIGSEAVKDLVRNLARRGVGPVALAQLLVDPEVDPETHFWAAVVLREVAAAKLSDAIAAITSIKPE